MFLVFSWPYISIGSGNGLNQWWLRSLMPSLGHNELRNRPGLDLFTMDLSQRTLCPHAAIILDNTEHKYPYMNWQNWVTSCNNIRQKNAGNFKIWFTINNNPTSLLIEIQAESMTGLQLKLKFNLVLCTCHTSTGRSNAKFVIKQFYDNMD